MLNNVTHTSQYTDISNKVKEVKHSVILNTRTKELEEQIVEDLYRIFTHKAG